MKSVSTSGKVFLVVAGMALSACQSGRYTSSLSLEGADDQHDLAERVTTTIDAHKHAQEAFDAAYVLIAKFTQARTEVNQALYNELLDQVDECASGCDRIAANNVRLDDDAAQMFMNWNIELDQFSSLQLRTRSEERMQSVKGRFDVLSSRLHDTHARMETALVGLKDYVLFFNHNLNTRSASGLDFENESLAQEIRALNAEVEGARFQGNDFIDALQGGSASTPGAY